MHGSSFLGRILTSFPTSGIILRRLSHFPNPAGGKKHQCLVKKEQCTMGAVITTVLRYIWEGTNTKPGHWSHKQRFPLLWRYLGLFVVSLDGIRVDEIPNIFILLHIIFSTERSAHLRNDGLWADESKLKTQKLKQDRHRTQ